MDKDKFDSLVTKAIKEIPTEFREKLENVSIFVEDYPTQEQLRKLNIKHSFLLGLYEGTPQTKRGGYGIGGQLPDRIVLFRIPILRLARDTNQLLGIIRATIMHEVAHHFGMDEDMVRRAERERIRRKTKQ